MTRSRRKLWLLLPFLLALELLYWFLAGPENLVEKTRYPVLRDCPEFGVGRIVCNFQHFSLFWKMPPPDRTYSNILDLWLSDGSYVFVNLFHIVFFLSAGVFIPFIFRVSASETFTWLMVWNVLHEYVGEGWMWDPSFSDLWSDTLFSFLGCSIAFWMRTHLRKRATRKNSSRK